MGSRKKLELLYQYALKYRFLDFNKLFMEMQSDYPEEELLDAYLMQAQIKVCACDDTFPDDFEMADSIAGEPRLPCLGGQWQPDSSNRFIVFKKTPNALERCFQVLSQARERLNRWYGTAGGIIPRQIQSEILYFLGDLTGAIELAGESRTGGPENRADAILAEYVLFRCYLAQGNIHEAEEAMLNMIRIAKNQPEYLNSYRTIRDWANLTTGWSGDTPRFQSEPGGEMLPVFDDRLEAINKGISRLSLREASVATYAEHRYTGAYTMRQYFMDIFHAIHWFQVGDRRQAEAYFLQAYRVSAASGLVMPFVEYGRQMIPLLEHIRDMDMGAPDWIARILTLARQYEESLDAYRA